MATDNIWEENKGEYKSCPDALLNTKITVEYREGFRVSCLGGDNWSHVWDITGDARDIIKYKIGWDENDSDDKSR